MYGILYFVQDSLAIYCSVVLASFEKFLVIYWLGY